MIAYSTILFGQLLRCVAVASGVLYAGMVLMRYRTDGARYPLSLELGNPARSVMHLAVWLGVKVLDVSLRLASAISNMLLEASAEVGEWIMRLSPTVQGNIRSRFLV